MFAPKAAKAQTKESTAGSTSSSVRRHTTLAARRPGHGPAEQLLMFQRTLGNQATQRLLAKRGPIVSREAVGDDHEKGTPGHTTTLEAPRGSSRDFSTIPVFSPDRVNRPPTSFPPATFHLPGGIQRKLAVGEANDTLEREADRVADQVMRMPAPVVGATLQRKCDVCEEAERTGTLRTKEENASKPASMDAPPIVDEVLRYSGEPLDAPTRDFFEPRFGRDFSQVRVHTDDRAAESAHSVGALAYTAGRHIAFARGRYAPASWTGQALLAHELAHVVQQGGSAGNSAVRRYHVDPATGRQAFDCGDFTSKPKLEDCLNDTDRLRPGDRGDSVIAVQNALLHDGQDLGPKGVDGVYGAATGRAVMAFKSKYHLGSEQYPDVGPGTMKKLDELCPATPGPPPPTPIPVPPAPPPAPTFRCGPNVSSQVRGAVAKVISTWASWSPSERDTQCDALDSLNTGAVAWDIEDLHIQGWIAGYQPSCATTGASPPCDTSVEVDSNCYYAGSANYVIFGTMCHLCDTHLGKKWHTLVPGFISGFPKWYMQKLITLYKGPGPIHGPAPNYTQSMQWAEAGYDGWPSGGTPPIGDRSGCTIGCPTPYTGRPFIIHWWPHAPF